MSTETNNQLTIDNLCKDAKDMIGSFDKVRQEIKKALARNAVIDNTIKTIEGMEIDSIEEEILDEIKEIPKTDLLPLVKQYQSLLIGGRVLLRETKTIAQSSNIRSVDPRAIEDLKKLEFCLKKELKGYDVLVLAMTSITKELGINV